MIGLSPTLIKLIERYGTQDQVRQVLLTQHWPSIVGEHLDRHTRPGPVRGTQLHIRVDRTAWLRQLQPLRPLILDKVNRFLGEPAFKQVVFDLAPSGGQHRRQHPHPASQTSRRAGGSSRLSSRLAQSLQVVPDPDLRALLQRVMIKSLRDSKARSIRSI